MIEKKKPYFLSYLHSFRGFAIICIVAGHALSAVYLMTYHRYNFSNPILFTGEILFNGCTLYFTLISGLLYSAVLKEKSYKEFYINKFLYVFLPYLLFTILYSIIKFERYNSVNVSKIDIAIKHLTTNLIFGGANFVLWYIPVLFGLYLLTPLFNFLLVHKRHTIVVLWIIILLPLISSGIKIPTVYRLVISKIIYFSGAYVLGMYLGVNLEASMNWLKKQLLPILALAIISTLLLFYLHYYTINKLDSIKINIQDSVYYIQKICCAILAIVFLKQMGEKQPVWLKRVAVDSTPIYFIHGAIVFSCAPLFLFRIESTYIAFGIFISAIGLLLFTIVLSMSIAFLIKKVCSKKSRMIIGS